MKISGGIVSYEDGIKSIEGDQYSPTRKVRVELNFGADSADEGVTDAEILGVINKAQSFVQEKLGLSNPTAKAKRTVHKEQPEGPTVAETQEKTVMALAMSSKATAKVLNDKEKLAQAQGLLPDAAPANLAKATKPAADPAAIEEEPAANEVDDALADLGVEEAPPVTDADLNAAVKARNTEIKDPVAIRSLIAEYNGGPGHTLQEIPAEKRHEFLKRLKNLKKAA